MKHFTTMFFSALLMLLGGELFLPAYAQQPLAYESQPLPAQRQQQRTLQSVLKELEKEYQVNFTYQSDIVERKQVKQQDLLREQRNLDNILNELLNPLGLIYQKVDKNYYLIYPAENSQKVPKIDRENRSSTKDIPVIPDQYQPAVVRANPISIPLAQTISGQVTELVSGEDQPGVNILAKGTSTGTVTDVEGNYRLTVADEVTTLVFSSIGYETTEESINGRSMISIALSPDVQSLSEVVVVGYGTQKKINLTGSVSTVDGEELTQVPSASTSGLLAGRFPGLITNQASGLPGEDQTNISIRGFSGDPLILVDGVQIEGGLDRIDPNDIASISVLKDASAAVYGSRAGNGVVLVTTKRGQTGPPQLSYDGSYTMQEATAFLQPVNAGQYVELYREADLLDIGDANATYTLEDLANFRAGAPGFEGGDWQNALIKNFAPLHQHSLKVSGGSENVKYFTSVGFTDQESYFRSRDFDYTRFNTRSNIDVSVNENFSFQIDLAYRVDDQKRPHDNENSSINETFTQLSTAVPTLPTEFPDPSFIPWSGFLQRQPVARTTRSINGTWDRRENTFRGKLGLTYRFPFIQGMQLRAEINTELLQRSTKTLRTPFEIFEYDAANDEYISRGVNGSLSSISDAQFRRQQIYPLLALEYERGFGDHDFKFLALAEQITREESGIFAGRQDLLTTTVPEVFIGSQDLQTANGSSFADIGRKSVVSRLNYSFKERYLLEVAFRADGNVLFAPDTRWGYFPSVAAGWVISREPFLQNSRVFDQLKVRLSYSQLGDDSADELEAFAYLPGFEQTGVYILGDNQTQPRIRTLGLPNPILSWEEITLYNFGIEAAFLDGRLSVEADVFYRNREGLVGQNLRDIPSTFGAQLPLVNLNSRNNRGFEMLVNYQQRIGNVRLNIAPNFTFARARWGEVRDQEEFEDTDLERINKREGQWVNRNFGYISDGIFMSQEDIDAHPVDQDEQGNTTLRPGDIRYVDLNGDGVINFRDQDEIAFASNTPEIVYGLNLGISYGNFTLSALFQGASRFSFNPTGNDRTMFSNFSTPLDYHYDLRWQPDPDNPGVNINPDAQLPAATTSPGPNNNLNSDFYRQNVTFVRLKNINLAYNLPESVLQTVGFSSAQVYLAGLNIFTVSNLGIFKNSFDPEGSTDPDRQAYSNVPITRNYTVGVRLSF